MQKKIQGLLIVLLVFMMSVIGVLAYMVLNPKEQDKLSNESLVIDESNLEEVVGTIEEAVEDGMFEVNMNVEWSFPNGESASTDAVVANGTANRCPISFEVILGEEVLYTSTIIPVGKQIKDIVLEKDLEPGIYNAVCQYHLWNEDGTEKSRFAVNIQLQILE